jgi:hypothetical protein
MRKVTKKVITKNQPSYRINEMEKCIIDPTCEGDLSKAQFIVMPFETSKSELMQDKDYENYKNLDKIFGKDGEEMDPGAVSDAEFTAAQEKEHSFEFKDQARKKLTAYEYYGYWDIHDTGITKPIKATYVNNTMIGLEELETPHGKLPFVLVQYLPIRKSVYGEPDGALLEDKQDILGAVYRGMIDIMGRSANGQVGMAKGMLDQANKKKYENGEDFFYNQGFDPRVSVHTQTYPEIPNSALQLLQLQSTEAESLTGVKTFSTGISGQALGSTATGARGALDSASKRELGILRRLSKGIEEIGRMTIAMNAMFLSDEEVIRVTEDEFRTVSRDDLEGNMDLRLTISTAESDNQKAEELAFMLQTTGQTMGPEFTQIILSDIAKLRKMPDLAEKIEQYQPQPDPMQQELQMLELELKKAQVQNEYAKARENEIDYKLKEAKTANELAKAGKTASEKDTIDQTFLEKDAGLDHAKEMEKKEFEYLSKVEQEAMKSLSKPQQGV